MFQHLKRPGVFGAKLLAGGRKQGLGRAVEQTKPDPIPDGKLQSTVISIVMLACILLRLQEPVADFRKERVASREQIIDGFGVSRALLIR